MIDFGRQAFEPVLSFVEEPPAGITRLQIGSCINTLRMMVNFWGMSAFSESEHQRMKQVAEKYIEKIHFITMDYAISLAYSLKEESLLQMASTLINDDSEMAKRQVSNIDWLKRTTS